MVSVSQFANASAPIYSTLFGISILPRLLHPRKADAPMSVTLSHITTFERLEQSEKAPILITLTLLGRVTLVSALHFAKVLHSISVMPSGIAARFKRSQL